MFAKFSNNHNNNKQRKRRQLENKYLKEVSVAIRYLQQRKKFSWKIVYLKTSQYKMFSF